MWKNVRFNGVERDGGGNSAYWTFSYCFVNTQQHTRWKLAVPTSNQLFQYWKSEAMQISRLYMQYIGYMTHFYWRSFVVDLVTYLILQNVVPFQRFPPPTSMRGTSEWTLRKHHENWRSRSRANKKVAVDLCNFGFLTVTTFYINRENFIFFVVYTSSCRRATTTATTTRTTYKCLLFSIESKASSWYFRFGETDNTRRFEWKRNTHTVSRHWKLWRNRKEATSKNSSIPSFSRWKFLFRSFRLLVFVFMYFFLV